MALKINVDAQTVFFNNVFGLPSSGAYGEITTKVKSLMAAGYTFEVALYDVKAFFKGKVASVTLTTGTTSLVKGSVDPVVIAQNKTLIADWIEGLWLSAQVPLTPTQPKALGVILATGVSSDANKLLVIKAIRTATGLGLAESKNLADMLFAKKAVLLTVIHGHVTSLKGAIATLQTVGVEVPPSGGSKPVTASQAALYETMVPQSVDAVIDLKAAQALGQKVHGTSPGSVYYCVALSEHVKVAARLYKGGSVSIRAEWTDDPTDELTKLADSGLQMKLGQKYGSVHFDAGEVPVQRVVGAFLVGTGINWKAAVMSGANLVIGEKL